MSIHSEYELKFAQSLSGHANTWIGGALMPEIVGEPAGWMWIDGTGFGFSNWAEGEPSDPPDPDQARILNFIFPEAVDKNQNLDCLPKLRCLSKLRFVTKISVLSLIFKKSRFLAIFVFLSKIWIFYHNFDF